MKQISLKALIAATAALAAPTAYAFLHGATLPDYDTWPDNHVAPFPDEANIYSRVYRGVQVNEDGSISEFSGNDYVQMVFARDAYIENFVPETKVNLWSYGTFGVEWFSEDMKFNGDRYLTDPDRHVMISSTVLVDDGAGNYHIERRRSDEYSHHATDGVRFKINDGSADMDDWPDFYPTPYDSLHNIDSYSMLLVQSGNKIRPYDYRIVLDCKMTLTDHKTPVPSLPFSKVTVVPCQIISQSVADLVQVASGPQIHQQGVMVNSVMIDDALYIQGLFPGKAGVWLKGSIDGDMVTFKRGSIAALGDSISYLSTYDMEVEDAGDSRYVFTFNPLQDDLVFKFDRSTFTLSEPNHTFAAMPDIEETWSYTADTYSPCPIPAFVGANGSRLEDKPLTPSKPQFLEVYGGFDEWWHYCTVNFAVSNISEEGEMMDADKLFYTVKVGDKPVTITPQQWPLLEENTTEIPYIYSSLGRYGEKDGDVSATGYQRDMYFHYRQYDTNEYDVENSPVEIRLVYKGGGEERWSEPLVCGTPNSVDEIDSPDAADAPVEIYNLQGVYVGAGLGDLAKGVYLMKRGTKTEKVYKR